MAGSRSSAHCDDTPLQTCLRLTLASVEPGLYHPHTRRARTHARAGTRTHAHEQCSRDANSVVLATVWADYN